MSKALDLDVLGFTKEELQERVIARICDQLLDAHFYDYDDEEPRGKSTKFSQALTSMIQRRIEQAVNKIAAKHIEPSVEEFIRNFVIQETNAYGEKTGKAVTFTEYLVKIAHEYIKEPVDYEGQSESDVRRRGGSWYRDRNTQTRVTHLIDKHFHYSIQTSMSEAVKTANAAIADGIQKAVAIKLGEIVGALKVEVKTK